MKHIHISDRELAQHQAARNNYEHMIQIYLNEIRQLVTKGVVKVESQAELNRLLDEQERDLRRMTPGELKAELDEINRETQTSESEAA